MVRVCDDHLYITKPEDVMYIMVFNNDGECLYSRFGIDDSSLDISSLKGDKLLVVINTMQGLAWVRLFHTTQYVPTAALAECAF